MTLAKGATGDADQRPAGQRAIRSGPKQVRDADATRRRILAAATKEFARFGLGGARVDAIAERSKANKRMIYHYFKSKDDLFRAVLESVYADIRSAEQKLDLDSLEPEDALRCLVAFTWNYYLKTPEFLALVASANLHRGRHLDTSARFRELHENFTPLLSRVLKRGAAKGVFRDGVDPVQLNISIAGLGFYYLTNRYTQSLINNRDLMTPAALDERLAFNLDSVMRIVRR